MDNRLFVTVFLPLAVGFVMLFLPGRWRRLSQFIAMVVCGLAFVLSIMIFRGGPAAYEGYTFNLAGIDLTLNFAAEPLSKFILLFAMGFGVLITLYSLKALAPTAMRFTEYYGAILLTIGGSAGIILSDNLLFLLIFWEIVTASLYILITTGGKHSNFAATKSFAMIAASDAALLIGILMIWVQAGSFNISAIRLQTDSTQAIIAFLLLMLAAITKAGAMPLHTWLPTSGEYAPPSVMALLPAAIDKLLGIYLLVLIVRKLFVMQSAALQVVLAVIGVATIIIAVMVAMVQHNLKKLLSYHAISQVGYMILGIATLTPVGIAGGLFHMLNHAIYKCCLFLCGGAVEQSAGTAELDKLGGLGKKMPITFVACLIAALSISGIPPFNGFVSKWMIYQGVIQMPAVQADLASRLWPVWLACAMFGSALTLASFVKVLHSAFLSRLPDNLSGAKEVSKLQTTPMIVLAGLCVFFGVFYYVPLNNFIYPALGIEPGTIAIGTWESGLASILIIAGIVLGLLILIVSRIASKVRIVPTWTCGEVLANEQMIIPGTHFYKTVSSMGGLRQMYSSQEKGHFDLYDQGGRLGLTLTNMLKSLHCGLLPVYLNWVTLGLLLLLFILCKIW
ncbi:MAG: proton-conducting transporter membrane subunit [Planctomycetota bacterium]